MYSKKYNLWHLLGFHNCSNAIEFGDFGLGGETKIEYDSPWSVFGTKYTHYQCLDCGRKFWMPSGEFEKIRLNEKIIKILTNKQSN